MSAKSHFFIESGGFPAQLSAQGFGPQSETVFNLTSRFSLDAPKKAFSICKGVVLVQPQTGNPDKVNLFLRPYNQPFPGLNIKYFVYRGLQKSDFFTTDSEPLIIAKSSSTSDFINKINEDFNAFHKDRVKKEGETTTPIPVPPFTAKFIGYEKEKEDDATNGTLLIPLSDFFFKESKFVAAGDTFDEKDDFELPLIDIGKSLGNFAEGICGIDVVLNYGDYKHDFDNTEFTFNLEYARKPFAEITVDGSTDFIKKLQREQSTQFIDIAAFYGLFANEGKVETTISSNEIISKAGTAIYTDLLFNFFNKNKVYVYIQSNRHRSYNFYNNYKLSETNYSNIKIGTCDNLIETNYGNLNWPILVFDNNQLNSNDYNDISIALTASLSYEEISLYILTGSISTESERDFVIKENLLDLENNSLDSTFTKTISFKVPNSNEGGQKKNISSLIRFTYIGKELDFSSANNYTIWSDKKRHSLYNNIFPNLTIVPVFNNSQNFLTASFNRESLINYKGFSNYMNESVLNGLVVFQEGKKDVANSDSSIETFSKEKVLFIAKKIETLDEFSIHKTEVFAQGVFAKKADIDSSLTDYSNYFSSLYGSKDYNLKHYIINDLDTDIKILSLNLKEDLDFDYYNLGLTKEELNILREIVPYNSSNINFYLKENTENSASSLEMNTNYLKYSLGVVFENNNGKLSVMMPSVPIYVYGISHNFLTTASYTEYEEKSITGSIINTTDII
ncbi:hypothetical protein [Flavobacterium tistrianum]|uniref:hypothetical protein n=1 Tax=Flavobacterium tistrianum TaxID=1685414 RepID=UPI000DABBE2B|nr:hypothetical protein [Flavobacterium tistrianum]KAF2342838.1 hypothetical protein DMB71_01650 [Flavobacterium tistrianum]